MPTYWVIDKQEKRITAYRWTNKQMLLFFLQHNKAHTCSVSLAAKDPYLASFESLSKPDKFNRCKNKEADGEASKPPPPWSPIDTSLSPFPPVLLPWLADWQATVRILNERPFQSCQSVSHLGKGGFGWGEQPGFRLWSPGVMTEPQAEKSGESLPEARFSIYSRFFGKSFPTCSF